jgi:hypothetical protein
MWKAAPGPSVFERLALAVFVKGQHWMTHTFG